MDVDPHDPTTTSKPEAPMQSLNQLPMVIEPAVKQIQPDHEDQSLQAIENKQEYEASNLMYCTKVEF